MKHIENLTAQLERLQRENQEQAERIKRADASERELVAKVLALENALEQRNLQHVKKEERAQAAHEEKVVA